VENIITLTKRQYWYAQSTPPPSLLEENANFKSFVSVITNPVEEGVPQLGKRKLVKGPKTFFLLPGEAIEENKIKEGK